MLNGSVLNDAGVNALAAGDEAVYQAWLRDPSAAVGYIVHLGYHGTSAVYPDYVAFTAKLSNFAIAGYREVVRSIPSFTRAISDDLTGEVVASIGELVLDNTDGALDLWHNLAIDGQPVRVYHGDPAWSVDRFRLLIDCLAEGVTGADEGAITIRLRGLEHGANIPLQTDLVPTAVSATAPSNLPLPLAFGRVFNVTPAIIDEANETRQWNDGAVTEVTDARDDGSRFRTNQIAISAVNAGTDTISTATSHGFVRDTRVRCDVGTLPVAATWRCLAWSGQQYLAIAMGSDIAATSPDGITWTQRAMPASRNWQRVVWTGSVFVAIVYLSDVVAVSPDGINWTEYTMPVSDEWSGLAWSGTTLCAVASSSDIAATSTDNGQTWVQRTLPVSAGWGGIVWTGTAFVAIASGSTNTATSPDGINWSAAGAMPSVSGWGNLAWSGSILCAISNTNPTDKAATSNDGGATWVAATLPSSGAWFAIEWNGEVFCAVRSLSATAATSPDGTNWTARTTTVSTDLYTLKWNGEVFCTVGASSTAVITSADGITWTATANTLPAPLAINTDYWVLAEGLTTTEFRLSATRGGTLLGITGTDTGALLVGFHWTADLTTGKIYLDSKPSGVLTIDGTAGTTSAASILPTVLGAVNVDAASQAAFATTCAQTVGIYVADRRNRLDVARDIMSGLGAWYGYDRFTMLRMGRVESSYTAHQYEIIEDEIESGSLVIERMIPPAKLHRIGYRKNWTNQAGQLVAGVSAEARGLYSGDYSASAATLGDDEGADGSEFHKLAIKPDVIESMMAYGYDALTEAQRRDAMFYGWGVIFRATVGLIGSQMNPGDVVKVTHSRYGLGSGVRMALVSVEDRPSDYATVLKFFSALSAYTPGQI